MILFLLMNNLIQQNYFRREGWLLQFGGSVLYNFPMLGERTKKLLSFWIAITVIKAIVWFYTVLT